MGKGKRIKMERVMRAAKRTSFMGLAMSSTGHDYMDGMGIIPLTKINSFAKSLFDTRIPLPPKASATGKFMYKFDGCIGYVTNYPLIRAPHINKEEK